MLAVADAPGLVLAQASLAAEEKSEVKDQPGGPEKGEPQEAASSETKAASSSDQPESTPAGEPKPSNIEPVNWTVTFGEEKITHATLAKSIRKQMEAIGLNAYFELTNTEYAKDYDPDRGHASWKVSISLPADQGLKVLEAVQSSVEATPVFPSSNTIGGKVASDTQWRAAAALLASLVFIVAYIWIRFQRVMFGLAAVVALIHDVLVTLGAIALTYWLAPFLGFMLIDEFQDWVARAGSVSHDHRILAQRHDCCLRPNSRGPGQGAEPDCRDDQQEPQSNALSNLAHIVHPR